MKTDDEIGRRIKQQLRLIILLASPILLSFLFLSQTVYAQSQHSPRFWVNFSHPVKFERISVEHGLSQASVLCICQDSRGFMWFGTEDGLNKYDGYTFEVFKFEPGNPHAISSNVIWRIMEDRAGNLWIGSNGGGLSRYDREKNKFHNYFSNPVSSQSLLSNDIRCMMEDRNGVIWMGGSGGELNKMIPPNGPGKEPVFTAIRTQPSASGDFGNHQLNDILQDSRGIVWIASEGGGLFEVRETAGKSAPSFIRHSASDVWPDAPGLDYMQDIEEDEMGQLWIGSMEGLLSFNSETGRFTRYTHNSWDPRSLSHNIVRRIYKDRAGMLWIGADGGGLNKLLPGETEQLPPSFVSYRYNAANPFSLSNNAVESIYEDRSGVLWVGVYNGGLNKLIFHENRGVEREYQQFPHYQSVAGNPNSLSHNHVNAIVEDQDGVLWVGTDGGGLNKITPGREDPSYLHFRCYRSGKGESGVISDDIVTALTVDSRGTLWVGAFTGGLNRRIPPNNPGGVDSFQVYRHNPANPYSLNGNFVRTLYEDRKKRLWVGMMDTGLDWMDRESGCFYHFVNHPSDPSSISDNNIFAILEDHLGRLWVGAVSGLNISVPPLRPGESMKFTRILHDPLNPQSIGNNFIRAIYEDSSGHIWIGANGGGLNLLLHPPNGAQPARFKRYNVSDGLPNDAVHGILEDEDGFLWLSTNKGLSRFNPGSGEFHNFDAGDGLQGGQFNGGACFKSKTGEMFFGGNNGFNIFHPFDIRENSVIPSIAITRLLLFNRPVPIGKSIDGRAILTQSISETHHLILSHRDSVISFEFAALHYVNPTKNSYAYIMEGLENEWNHVDNRRFVTYTTLPPGEYIFRVIAANNDGVWNKQGVALAVTITPPFYKTWWFRVLLIFLLAVLFLGVHLYRVRRIIRNMEKKYEKTAVKPDKADEYLKTLLHCMETEKPHLDPDLTLHKLSGHIAIPYHILSQIINGKLDKTFFDFINEYRVNEAVRLLQNSVGEYHNIQDIAPLSGFNSQSAFNRAFKKQTQQTPSDYLLHHRVQIAVQKLTDPAYGHLSIPQIAQAAGFSTQSSFNRAFKKITGKTPSQYKRNL